MCNFSTLLVIFVKDDLIGFVYGHKKDWGCSFRGSTWDTKIWDLFLGEEFLEEDRAGSEESGGYGIASCLHAVLYVAGWKGTSST